jgi:MFS family permease
MTGVLGFAISFVVFGLADRDLTLMYISRIMAGFFAGSVMSVITAYVADITTNEERTKAMGLIGMSIGMGFTMGPLFGGLLSKISIMTPFFAAALLALVTFVLAGTKMKETLSREERMQNAKGGGGFKLIVQGFRGKMSLLYILALIVTLTLATIESTLQLFSMMRFGVTPLQVGIMLVAMGLVGAAIQGGVVRRLIKPGQEPIFISIGIVFCIGGFLLLTTAHTIWTTTFFLLVFGIGNGLMRPCVSSLITQKTPVSYGIASGLSSSMDSLGRIAGPLLGTYLLAQTESLPYLIGSMICLVGMVLLWSFVRADKQANLSQITIND